jgi:micrococcal nuclease
MKLLNQKTKNWIYFTLLTLFLIILSELGYSSLPSNYLANLQNSQIQVLGTKDDHNLEVAQVKRIIDGDTIELTDGRKVRYIGVDTPETKHPTKEQQCYGQAASEKNKELVEGKTVKLEKDVSETDRYGRLLRYVWVDDQLINLVLVRDGFAIASSYPPDVAKQEIFRDAEKTAREKNVGLWGSCQ